MKATGFIEQFFSLLPILIGIVIAIAFSYAKKKATPAQPELNDTYEEEEPEDFVTITEATGANAHNGYFTTDHYRDPKTPVMIEDEEPEEEFTGFDIRQAIISSEILKRPEY